LQKRGKDSRTDYLSVSERERERERGREGRRVEKNRGRRDPTVQESAPNTPGTQAWLARP